MLRLNGSRLSKIEPFFFFLSFYAQQRIKSSRYIQKIEILISHCHKRESSRNSHIWTHSLPLFPPKWQRRDERWRGALRFANGCSSLTPCIFSLLQTEPNTFPSQCERKRGTAPKRRRFPPGKFSGNLFSVYYNPSYLVLRSYYLLKYHVLLYILIFDSLN